MDIRLATDASNVALQPRSALRESASATPGNVLAPERSADAGSEGSRRETAPAEATRTEQAGEFYISPFLTFDARSLTVIFQIRDTESGDVTRQFPAESVVERYRQDPSARPFVLPESPDGSDETTGPPPPTIGGPVAAAAAEAEEAAVAAGAAAAPGLGRTADESTVQPSSAPSRPSVDLVA